MSVIIRPTGSMSFPTPTNKAGGPSPTTYSQNPPAAEDKVIQDIERILINYLTGKPDLALEFNADRLITHERNAAGNLMYWYDIKLCTFMRSEPVMVVDNKGNAIVTGPGPGKTYTP